MSALEVECPLCGAAPMDPCRSLRVAENAATGRDEYGNYGHRTIKRPHREPRRCIFGGVWVTGLSYWLRPYDMLADRRRWRWQKQARCGLPPMPPEVRAEFYLAVQRKLAREAGRCEVPPLGWWCSRAPGHDGPCAAREFEVSP